MQSYWEKKTFFYPRHLIICGAGFTGLATAIYYKRKYPERSVLILEKDPVNGGASSKNAGFATFGSPSELLADLAISGEDEVFNLVEKRWKGLLNLRNLLGDKNIGYRHDHGYELFKPGDPLFNTCIDNLDYLNKMLSFIAPKVFQNASHKIAQFGFQGIENLIEITEEGQVDTGMMYASLLNLAKETGVEIFNGIEVLGFEEGFSVKINTRNGAISANIFLIANNGFASQILKDSETVPARAQVLITTPVSNLKLKGNFHMDEGYYYFRNIDGRVLLGGARNIDFETETTTELALNERIQQQLKSVLQQIILPGLNVEIEQQWSGIMGMGTRKQVILKKLSQHTYCAIRLSGIGLALSTQLGREAAELISAEQ